MEKIWGVVAAAGNGSRFGGTIPKQYARFGEQTVLEATINKLLQWPRIEKIIVAIAPNDSYWSHAALAKQSSIVTVMGGEQRFHSVLNGLNYLLQFADDNDWVLVHDAVRPCVKLEDIERLYKTVCDTNQGGLLVAPVTDTLKQIENDNCVVATVNRDQLYRALTPQLFRLRSLKDALQAAIEKSIMITDEAMAMELAGHTVVTVVGDPSNIKITFPYELKLAELIQA